MAASEEGAPSMAFSRPRFNFGLPSQGPPCVTPQSGSLVSEKDSAVEDSFQTPHNGPGSRESLPAALRSDASSPSKEKVRSPKEPPPGLNAEQRRAWALQRFTALVASDVFALARPKAEHKDNPHLRGIDQHLFRNLLTHFLGPTIVLLTWGQASGGLGGKKLLLSIEDRKQELAKTQKGRGGLKIAPPGHLLPGGVSKDKGAEDLSQDSKIRKKASISSQEAEQKSHRTPTFTVAGRIYYDHSLIVNPEFVVGSGEDRRFTFRSLHPSDSCFNDSTRELFDLLDIEDLRAYEWSFADMLKASSSIQRPTLGLPSLSPTSPQPFPLILPFDSPDLFEVHIMQLGGCHEDGPGAVSAELSIDPSTPDNAVLHVSGQHPAFACDEAVLVEGMAVNLKRKFVDLSPAFFPSCGGAWSREVALPSSCDVDKVAKHILINGNACYIFKKKEIVKAPPKFVKKLG